jgi:phage-related protein
MAGPIKISVLADVGQAVKSVTHFSDVVDEETKRVVTTLGDSKLTGGWGKLQEGFDVADTRAMGFRDTITGVQDTMTGFQGLMGDRKPGQTFADSLLQVGMGVGDLASGMANFVVPMGAAMSGIKAFGLAAKISAGFQWLLNLAMSANPVVLVIIVIVALVAAIIIAYKKSETFRNIVNALGRAFMTAVGKVRDFVVKAVGWIRDLPGKISAIFGKAKDLLFNAGWNIINGLWQGVSAIWNQFTGWFSGAMSWVADKAKSILGINSPSKVFHDIGANVGKGMALGIESTQDAVLKATQGLIDIPSSVTGPTATVNVSGGSTGALGTASNPVTLEIRSSGQRMDDMLVEMLRGAVRVGGGNVQTVLGR